jgi:hypothetical protein
MYNFYYVPLAFLLTLLLLRFTSFYLSIGFSLCCLLVESMHIKKLSSHAITITIYIHMIYHVTQKNIVYLMRKTLTNTM